MSRIAIALALCFFAPYGQMSGKEVKMLEMVYTRK